MCPVLAMCALVLTVVVVDGMVVVLFFSGRLVGYVVSVWFCRTLRLFSCYVKYEMCRFYNVGSA